MQKKKTDTINTAMENVVNVLILKSDEHNPLINSIEGHPFIKTPNMERLAKMGTIFDNCYSVSPLCFPARSAFMAGKYVHQIQAYNNCGIFPGEHPSYGQILKEHGIHTVHIGKVDSYRHIDELGFSETHTGEWPKERGPGDINFCRNPLAIRPLERPDGTPRPKSYGIKEKPFEKDEYSIQTAINWLTTTAKKMNKPWVMEINTSKPHFPMYVTQKLWDMYEGHDDLPQHGKETEPGQHPHSKDLQKHFRTDEFKEEWIKGLRRGYYGCVTYTDQKLGQLLDTLEQTGLINNTVIAYTTDHGEMLGQYGMWWKCSLYEESARVPMVIAGPGFFKGLRINTPVTQLDLLASIFRSNNCSYPNDWNGTPLQDIQNNAHNHVAFSEYHGHGTRASSYMIRKGKCKFIYYCEADNQLFDMESKEKESNNIIEQYPEIAREMESELRKICDPEKENQRAEEYIQKQLKAIDEADLKILPGRHVSGV